MSNELKAKAENEINDDVKLIVKLEQIRSSTYNLFGKKPLAFEKSFLKNLNTNGVFVVHTYKPLKDSQSRITDLESINSKLEGENAKYKEALERICIQDWSDNSNLFGSDNTLSEFIRIAEQALKVKG